MRARLDVHDQDCWPFGSKSGLTPRYGVQADPDGSQTIGPHRTVVLCHSSVTRTIKPPWTEGLAVNRSCRGRPRIRLSSSRSRILSRTSRRMVRTRTKSVCNLSDDHDALRLRKSRTARCQLWLPTRARAYNSGRSCFRKIQSGPGTSTCETSSFRKTSAGPSTDDRCTFAVTL